MEYDWIISTCSQRWCSKAATSKVQRIEPSRPERAWNALHLKKISYTKSTELTAEQGDRWWGNGYFHCKGICHRCFYVKNDHSTLEICIYWPQICMNAKLLHNTLRRFSCFLLGYVTHYSIVVKKRGFEPNRLGWDPGFTTYDYITQDQATTSSKPHPHNVPVSYADDKK